MSLHAVHLVELRCILPRAMSGNAVGTTLHTRTMVLLPLALCTMYVPEVYYPTYCIHPHVLHHVSISSVQLVSLYVSVCLSRGMRYLRSWCTACTYPLLVSPLHVSTVYVHPYVSSTAAS